MAGCRDCDIALELSDAGTVEAGSSHGATPAIDHRAWACARLAKILAERGDVDAAQRYMTRARQEGPPLAQDETRMAEAKVAFARRPDNPSHTHLEAHVHEWPHVHECL